MSTKRQILQLEIFIILIIFGSGCSIDNNRTFLSEVEPEPRASSLTRRWEAVYLAPSAEDTQIYGDPVPAGILVVGSTEQLMKAFDEAPLPQILYLHPDTVHEVDNAWLKGIYHDEVMIAAINTPVSELGTKLGVHTDIANLKMERLPEGFIALSAHHLIKDSGQESSSRHWMLTDFFESFSVASNALNMSAEFNVGNDNRGF